MNAEPKNEKTGGGHDTDLKVCVELPGKRGVFGNVEPAHGILESPAY
jgi:hypothetical protein